MEFLSRSSERIAYDTEMLITTSECLKNSLLNLSTSDTLTACRIDPTLLRSPRISSLNLPHLVRSTTLVRDHRLSRLRDVRLRGVRRATYADQPSGAPHHPHRRSTPWATAETSKRRNPARKSRNMLMRSISCFDRLSVTTLTSFTLASTDAVSLPPTAIGSRVRKTRPSVSPTN